MQQLIVQSHRGGGALAPENTLESFIATWKLGLIPEADLRTTNDGVIVAFHDADFARVVKDADTPLQKKSVQDVTFEELAALDVGVWYGKKFAGQHVRRVEELFALMRDCSDHALYLDIKDVVLPDLADLVRQFKVEKQVVLAAPDEKLLRAWRKLSPEGQTLLWMGGNESTLQRRLKSLRETNYAGITQLQIHVKAVRDDSRWRFKPSLEFLQKVGAALQAQGILFQTLPWLCDDPEVYRLLINAGSRSFASDYPEIALKVLQEGERAHLMTLAQALVSASETKI